MVAIAIRPFAARGVRDSKRVARRADTDRAEQRIAQRLGDGDERAFEELYARCSRATFGVLLQMLGDRERAADVQQQVFHEVWRRGAEYDADRAGLLTWVLTIARSRAIDELRRKRPDPVDPVDVTVAVGAGNPAAAPIAGGRPGTSEQDAVIGEWRIAGLLERLPEDERELLRMRFHDDLSQTQIAERTGIALGTIKARMVRGLERLREHLDAEATA